MKFWQKQCGKKSQVFKFIKFEIELLILLRVIWFQATESSGFRDRKSSRGVKLEVTSQT